MEEAVRAGADTIITASTNQCCHNSMTVLLAAREGMACRVIMGSWGDTRYRYETASNHTMIEFCGPEEVSVETSLPSGPVAAMPEAMDGVRFDSPVKAVDEIATLSNLISTDTRRSRFRKSRGAYFLKISHFDTCVLTKKYPLKSEEQRIANARVLKNFLCGDPLIRRENVRCKVKGVL